MTVRIYIYGQKEESDAFAKKMLSTNGVFIAGNSSNEASALREISNAQADAVFYLLDGSASMLRVAQQVYMLYPQSINVAIADEQLLNQQMIDITQSGIHYVFGTLTPAESILLDVENALTIESNRLSVYAGLSSLSVDTEVVTFYGPRGGIGKTSFILGMAASLALQKKKVAVLDFDLQFGDVSTLMGLEERETLTDVLLEQNDPSIDVIRKYLTLHKTGVNVLISPKNPEYAEKIEYSQIEKIISSMRTYYDYIFIDVSSRLDDIAMSCLEQATKVVLFTKADIATLKHTKTVISIMDSLGLKDKILLAEAMADKSGGISRSDIEKVLRLSIWASFPNDRKNAVEAINRGIPVSVCFPNSAFAKACENAVASLTGTGTEKKSLFRR